MDLPLIRELLPETCETEAERKDAVSTQEEADKTEAADKGAVHGAGAPADKTKFFEALEQARMLRREDYTADAWECFDAVYQQAKSFGALTGASQQETDEMTDKLLTAAAELRAEK